MALKKSDSVFMGGLRLIHNTIDTKHYNWFVKIVGGILCASIVAFGIFLGYRWHYVHKQQVAQKALAEAIEHYTAMVQSEHKDWDRIQMIFKVGAEQQAGSSLTPYFLAYQANALIHDDKKQEAIEVMDHMIKQLPSQSLLYNLYKTKQAIMRLDSPDEAVRTIGIEELISLGSNNDNIYKDMALYQLGNYYWLSQKKADAMHVWQELLNQYQHDIKSPSPWAQLAQQKIRMVVI